MARVIPGGTADKVFVLNMSTDRVKWSQVAASLARHGVRAERFPAVDGNSQRIVDEWRQYRQRGLESEREVRLQRRLIASPGAWGYLLTMKRLLLEAKERKFRSIMVFDDDVVLHVDFGRLLDAAILEMPPSWKLLYLGCTQTAWASVKGYSQHLNRARPVDGSFAYMIDASVFDDLIGSIERFDNPFDSGPLTELVRRFPDDCFTITPNIAIADVRYSDLRGPRNQEEFAAKARWALSEYDELPERICVNGAVVRELRSSEVISSVVILTPGTTDVARTLNSLRLQTDAKFEVLVIDNSGRKGTLDAIDTGIRRDTRFRLLSIEEPVSETTAARIAVDLSSGAFISFLPPNAVALPTHIASLRAGIIKDADAVRATARVVHEPVLDASCGCDKKSRNGSCETVESLLYGGLISRKILLELGHILELSESGFGEAIRRASIGRELRNSEPPRIAQYSTIPHLLVDGARVGFESAQRRDWEQLHSEIGERVRPSYQRPPRVERSVVLRIEY